jgi:hypothetical protein
MFKFRYLTVRLSPTKGGFQLHPNWGDCLEPTDCICTDGCSQCSGDCTGCTATCKGPDSAGAILVDREGEVEMMLDFKGLQAVVKKIEKADQGQKAARAKQTKRSR